jgi:cobyrinic acid a,c-diamide synthase
MMAMTAPGLIVAAPASGSGKTTFTLGLLRALSRRGLALASAKVGPDYIDTAFHAAASGRPCFNLDLWAMGAEALAARTADLGAGAQLVVCEGVMGLFDGADTGGNGPGGSTADIAAATGWPVILLVDLRRQAASAAALIEGFRRHRDDVSIAGVVFNQVASANHRAMVAEACRRTSPDLPHLGWIPRDPALALSERHLGLVQAGEIAVLDEKLDAVAACLEQTVDLDALVALARPSPLAGRLEAPLPPLGQHIAIARDEAFAFAYPAVLDGWRQSGAEISFFSPLADEAPAADADAAYLPGGYPELHAPRLAAARRFLGGLQRMAADGRWIYGECGGYMTLGRTLEDAEGTRHAMAGLLPVETSFAKRRLHLGYRQGRLAVDTPLGTAGTLYRGHEFHYASITAQQEGQPLFHPTDARGRDLAAAGQVAGTVCGSFLHLIQRRPC